MQKNPLIAGLLGALLLASLAILVLGLGFEYHARQLRRMEPQLVSIQKNKVVLDGLAMDCLEYSKRNPAIMPILTQVGLKPAAK
jgi:hypothetical protein